MGCFPGKTLWGGARDGKAFKGIVNFFSGGLNFTPLEFDTVDPEPAWVVVATGSAGQLDSTLEVPSRMKKALKLYSKLWVQKQ